MINSAKKRGKSDQLVDDDVTEENIRAKLWFRSCQ